MRFHPTHTCSWQSNEACSYAGKRCSTTFSASPVRPSLRSARSSTIQVWPRKRSPGVRGPRRHSSTLRSASSALSMWSCACMRNSRKRPDRVGLSFRIVALIVSPSRADGTPPSCAPITRAADQSHSIATARTGKDSRPPILAGNAKKRNRVFRSWSRPLSASMRGISLESRRSWR